MTRHDALASSGGMTPNILRPRGDQHPITEMSDAADRMSTGDLEIPEFDESGRDEVSLLAK